MEEQRAVVSLRSCEDASERRQRALWQGTASPQVTGDDLLVQAQLAGDAVERLRVQIQDGDRVRESRRSGGLEVPEPPLTVRGGEERGSINERGEGSLSCFSLNMLSGCLAPSGGLGQVLHTDS